MANGRPEFHHRLVVVSRSTGIEELAAKGRSFFWAVAPSLKRSSFAKRRVSTRTTFPSQTASGHPKDMLVTAAATQGPIPGSACQDSASSGIVFQESTCLANL